jgi:hypothetical protein
MLAGLGTRKSRFADVVHGADVQVVQRRNDFGLVCEARLALPVTGQLGWENLDHDRAVESGVASLVDLAPAARTDEGDDFITAEACARREWHGERLRGGLYRRRSGDRASTSRR